MNGSGMGALMQGFQQGYSFVDDAKRRQKHDEREEARFGREQKQWKKEDDYDAELKGLSKKWGFTEQGAEPAAAPLPQLTGDDDGNPLPQGAPAAAAPAKIAGLTEPGNIDLTKRPVVKNADGSISTVRSMSFNVDGKEVLIPTVSDDGRIMSDDEALATFKQTGKHLGKFDTPEAATAYAQNLHNDQDRMYSATPAPGNAPMAAMGTNPVPQPAVAAADGPRPVAAQGVPTPAPAAAPAQPSAPGYKPPPDFLSNPNKMIGFALDRAAIDLKHGKMDGAGLLTLTKLATGMKNENMDRAVKLLHQGRNEEAAATFDATGDHNGFKVLDSKDGVFKVGKTELPTKIVTLQAPDGSTRTINTAQTLTQMQDMDKVIDQAIKSRQLDVTEKHYDNTEKESARHHQATERSAAATLAAANGTLQLNREKFDFEKTQAGALTVDKLDKVGKEALDFAQKVYSPKDGADEAEKKALGDKAINMANSATAIYRQSYGLGQKITTMDAFKAAQLAGDPKNLVDTKHSDGNTYRGVMVNGRFVPTSGALAPTAAPAPAPAPAKPMATQGVPAPAYQPPPDSPAGQAVSQRRQAVEQTQAIQRNQAAAAQQQFATDAQSLPPLELVRKYANPASRALLTTEQKVALQQAQQQLRQ